MKKLFGFIFVLAMAFVLFACGKQYKIEVSADQANITVEKGESVTITPEFTEGETLVWKSSDEKVVKVEGGKITAVEEGNATITITISGKEDKASAEVKVTVKPISVKGITLTGKTACFIGDEFDLTLAVTPEGAKDKSVTWASSDATIATVTNGKVKALKVGEVTITATANDGSGVKAELKINVAKINVNNVSISGLKDMNVGDTQTVAATIDPANATNAGIEFSSSDTSVLTVTNAGVVTAVSAGTAKVIATSKDDATKKAELEITVAKLVEEITIDGDDEMNVNDTQKVDVFVDPDDATNKAYTLSSSDENVLTVDAEGNVKAIAAGKAKVIATASDGSEVTGELEITVKVIEILTLELEGAKEMAVGKDQTLTVAYNPENASYKEVEFVSSDAEVATVDETGKVTGVKAGSVVISATSKQDNTKTASLTIQVFDLTTAIALAGTADMIVGHEQNLTITTTPASAMQKFDFAVDNQDVVKVYSDGKLEAIGSGTAKVTVTAKDGSGVTAEFNLTATYELVYVKLGATEDLTRGEETLKLNQNLFATVDAALAAVAAGGKVVLYPGEYTEEINLDKSVTLSSDLANKNPVEDDTDFKDATKAAVMKCLILTTKANTTIEGLTFTGTARVGRFSGEVANFTFQNNLVYDTAEATVAWKDARYGNGVTTKDALLGLPGFITLSPSWQWVRNTSILNNKFDNVSDTPVFITCVDGSTIKGNLFKDIDRDAIRFDYASDAGHHLIEDNVFENVAYMGIYVQSLGGQPLDVEIYSNYFKNIGTAQATGNYNTTAAIANAVHQEAADAVFAIKYNIFEGCNANISLRTNVAASFAKKLEATVEYNAFILADANAMINRNLFGANGSDTTTSNKAMGAYNKNFYGTDLLTKLEVGDANYENVASKDATVYNNVYALEKAMPSDAHLPAYTATPTLKTVAEAYELELNTAVALKGTVSYVYSGGFWLKDETGAIYVFGHADEVKLGDKVEVEGNLYNYKDTKRLNFAKTVKVTESGTYTAQYTAKSEDEFKAMTQAGVEITLTNVLVTKISNAYVYCKVGATEFTINTNSNTEAIILAAYIDAEKTLTVNGLTYFKDGDKAMSIMARTIDITAQDGFAPLYYVVDSEATPYLNVVKNFNDITLADNMTIYFVPGVQAGQVVSETETKNILINKNGVTLQGTEAGAQITCPVTIADGVDGLTFKTLTFTGAGYVTSTKAAAGETPVGIKNVTFNGVKFDGVKSANDGTVHFWVPVTGFKFWNSECYFASNRGIRFETTITDLDVDNNKFTGKAGTLYDMIRGMAEVLGTVNYTNNIFDTTTQSHIWVANVGTAVYTIEGNVFKNATSVSIDFRACAKPTDETKILINIRFNDFSGANGWGTIRLRSQGLKDGQIVANVNFNKFHDIPLGEDDYYIDRPTTASELTYINCDYNWSDMGEPKSSWFCDQQTSMKDWNLDYLDFVEKFPEYAAEWTNSYAEKSLTSEMLGLESTLTVKLSNASKQTGTITNMPTCAAKKNTQYITLAGDFSKYSAVSFILVQWTNKTFNDIHLEVTYDGTTWFRCSESITTPDILTTNKDLSAAKAIRVSYTTTNSSNVQLGLRGIALLPTDETKVFYANENLLEDLPTKDADYTSTRWTREKYTDSWVSGGTMRSRSKDDVRVTNMDNGYGMTMRWTYNLNGGSLGLANKLTFKVGNYWSNAEAMQVKVKLVDKDGNDHFLIGSASEFGSVPVTTGLVDQELTFDPINVKSVVFVTKSAVNGSTYLYVGNLLLTYAAPAAQPGE
ncbi:MAG: Ig-like domain-containing protein [Bacilli bacterium]|nr:Ig-like domain-containing protein [Bacilli bacterium]